MKKKLSLLMLAAMPLIAFGQNTTGRTASKASVYPNSAKKTVVSVKTASKLVPTAYCLPSSNCSDGDVITNVTVAGINNTTTCSTGGYGDYTAMQGQIEAGQTYPISVTVGDGWFERVSAWVDFNKNDVFDADEYLGEIGEGTDAGGVLSGNISIPANLAAGSYRLRVMVGATGSGNPAITDACVPNAYGETEDYTLVIEAPAATGCLTSPNGQYPSATYTPNCNGLVANITTVGYAGEYSKVDVTSGTSYTFSVSKPDYFITISDADGTTVLGSGTGSLTWTSTLSGVVRFYVHTDAACGSGTSATIHTRSIKCGTPPPAPTSCEDFKVLSNNLENGGFFNGETAQKLAIDLPIGSTAFTIYGIEPTVIGTATSFNFNFYSDNAGLPGTLLGTRVGTINGNMTTGTNFGYDFIKYTVSFDSPFNFDANTKYWLEIVTDAVAWESSSIATLGTKDAFQNSGTSGAWVIGTDDYVFNLMCNGLAVNDTKTAQVNFYPNPVKDFLTINSKKAIETVHVYNISGQKMQVSSKLVNGKVDMSKLAPGMYIISTILEGGKNESFKVIKK